MTASSACMCMCEELTVLENARPPTKHSGKKTQDVDIAAVQTRPGPTKHLERVPRVECEVLAHHHLVRVARVLQRKPNLRDPDARRLGRAPCHRRVLERHLTRILLQLHHELHAHLRTAVRAELLRQRVTHAVAVLGKRPACPVGALGELGYVARLEPVLDANRCGAALWREHVVH